MFQEDKILNNKYKLIRPLGSGGMGQVYEGLNIKIGRKFAIKILKKELCEDHNIVKRFHQEAVAAAQIGHPNIIDIFDFDVAEDGSYYLVMEFLEGSPLDKILKKEAPLDILRAITIIKQVLSALSEAHKKEIIHRDIKPENIFVIPKGNNKEEIKLLDFGIAKISNLRLTETGIIMGSPFYMSPEQASDSKNVGNLSDLYSVSVVLYECVTGKVPYTAHSIAELIYKLTTNKPYPKPIELNPLIDTHLETIILKGMSFQINERHQSAQEFIENLELFEKKYQKDIINYTKKLTDSDEEVTEKAPMPTEFKSDNEANDEDLKEKEKGQSLISLNYSKTIEAGKKKNLLFGILGVFFIGIFLSAIIYYSSNSTKVSNSSHDKTKNIPAKIYINPEIDNKQKKQDNKTEQQFSDKELNPVYEEVKQTDKEIPPAENEISNKDFNIKKSVKVAILPQIPSKREINSVMKSVQKQLGICNSLLKVERTVIASITIDGKSGQANKIILSNYEETPAGKCINEVIKKAQFSRFRQESYKIEYQLRIGINQIDTKINFKTD